MKIMRKHEATFQAESTFDRLFEASVLLKALDGMVELISGLALLLLRPERIQSLIQKLTNPILKDHPHEFIARHIVHWANSFDKQAAIFAVVYLLLHGLIKVVLVIEVLRNHLWAYIALVIVTLAFLVYQIGYIIVEKTAPFGVIALSVLDILVVYFTAKEYLKQKAKLARG